MTDNQDPEFSELPLDDMDTPDLLMEATVWILAEEGYQGLTLRKVSEKAGKNRGLVHYYFESKTDLLASLIEHIHEGTSRLIGIRDDDPPSEKLSKALRFQAYGPGGVDENGRHYYLAILQLQALAAHDPLVREQMNNYHQFVLDLVAEIIKEGVDQGDFKGVDPKLTAQFFITTVDGARNTELTTNLHKPRENALNYLEEYISTKLIR